MLKGSKITTKFLTYSELANELFFYLVQSQQSQIEQNNNQIFDLFKFRKITIKFLTSLKLTK